MGVVKVQEEELLHNDLLRRKYGEECVSLEEGAEYDVLSPNEEC